MSILNPGESYDPTKAGSAALQPEIYPLPRLRRPWFTRPWFQRNKIICEEGWSLSFSGSSWRIDRYDYFEDERHLVLGGEGGTGQMDVFVGEEIFWEEPSGVRLDELTRQRVLHNITAALQWAGFSVGFFSHTGGRL